MLARGLAYHCYMSAKELDDLRAAQMARGEKPRYDGRWRPENAAGRAPPPGVAPVIRFLNPLGGTVAWDDAVKGTDRNRQRRARRPRSSRAPTARRPTTSASSSTTSTCGITHVIRGDDHVNNTPRQINILRALGGATPVYAHLPTVLTPEGDKLSKRHGAKSRDAVPGRRLPARGGGQLSSRDSAGRTATTRSSRARSSSGGSTSPDCHRRRDDSTRTS